MDMNNLLCHTFEIWFNEELLLEYALPSYSTHSTEDWRVLLVNHCDVENMLALICNAHWLQKHRNLVGCLNAAWYCLINNDSPTGLATYQVERSTPAMDVGQRELIKHASSVWQRGTTKSRQLSQAYGRKSHLAGWRSLPWQITGRCRPELR